MKAFGKTSAPRTPWEVAAWQAHRNAADRIINWQFTTDDARIKLRQLCPVKFEEDTQDLVQATLSLHLSDQYELPVIPKQSSAIENIWEHRQWMA